MSTPFENAVAEVVAAQAAAAFGHGAFFGEAAFDADEVVFALAGFAFGGVDAGALRFVIEAWIWDVDIPDPSLDDKPQRARVNTTEREASERKNDLICIECGLTEKGAMAESSRCLRCDHFGYGIFKGGRHTKW